MIELEELSYSELAASLDRPSKERVRAWQLGSVANWAEENIVLRPAIYAVEPGDNLGYEYKYINWPVVREQLLKGGIRLAALLNAIYGEGREVLREGVGALPIPRTQRCGELSDDDRPAHARGRGSPRRAWRCEPR